MEEIMKNHRSPDYISNSNKLIKTYISDLIELLSQLVTKSINEGTPSRIDMELLYAMQIMEKLNAFFYKYKELLIEDYPDPMSPYFVFHNNALMISELRCKLNQNSIT